MNQTVILAEGNTQANSSVVSVEGGEYIGVGIFTAGGEPLPDGVTFKIMQVTPGEPNYVHRLNNDDRSSTLAGPGTFYISRPAYSGAAFGVFTEA